MLGVLLNLCQKTLIQFKQKDWFLAKSCLNRLAFCIQCIKMIPWCCQEEFFKTILKRAFLLKAKKDEQVLKRRNVTQSESVSPLKESNQQVCEF